MTISGPGSANDPFHLMDYMQPAPAPAGTPGPPDDPLHLKAYVAPGPTAATTLVIPPPEMLAAHRLQVRIRKLTKELNRFVDKLDEGMREVAKVRGCMRSLWTVAAMLEQRAPWKSSAPLPSRAVGGARLHPGSNSDREALSRATTATKALM